MIEVNSACAPEDKMKFIALTGARIYLNQCWKKAGYHIDCETYYMWKKRWNAGF